MMLIDTATLKLHYFPKSDQRYAILSHTWGSAEEEVTYQEMVAPTRSESTVAKPGYQKVVKTCEIARKDYDIAWVWVDTCCIDKSSSAELSEAINSMFRWYQGSEICFAYLRDLDDGPDTFERSRWFTRGWTFQELIAPKSLVFFYHDWTSRGTKSTLTSRISLITGIPDQILDGSVELNDVPVASRFSWAAKRETSREEDIAYCLMGLFDVNMPLLYGEGAKAFIRLQESILSESTDLSLFLWKSQQYPPLPYSGLLAPTPQCFLDMKFVQAEPIFTQREFYITNRGIRLESYLGPTGPTIFAVLPLYHSIEPKKTHVGVWLQSVGDDLFVRAQPRILVEAKLEGLPSIFTVVKSLTRSQMEAISSNVLKIESFGRPIHCLEKQPPGSWDLAKQLLYAGHTGAFLGYAKLEADGVGFVLVCRFRNGYWAAKVVDGSEWHQIAPGFYQYFRNDPNLLHEEDDGLKALMLAYIEPSKYDIEPSNYGITVRFKARGMNDTPCVQILSTEPTEGLRTWFA